MIELLAVLLVLALVIFPIWTIAKISGLTRTNDSLRNQLHRLERELLVRRAAPSSLPTREEQTSPAEATAAAFAPAVVRPEPTPLPPVDSSAPVPSSTPLPPPPSLPPPLLSFDPPPLAAPPPEPAVFARPVPAELPTTSSSEPRLRVNWEQFMGAKLFAWLGGLAALLGVAFGLKYSFEHDLIPPEVRVAFGFIFAIGLVIGGLKINRVRYAITADTFCATGVVSLYAVTFACNSIYHFSFFGSGATFLLMSLITTAAFLLAVRLEGRVIAILGILGGFLTPILLSTGHDNPLGLFGYIALLDAGLIAVALHRRWNFLVPLGVAGTTAMQIGWAGKFFTDEKALTAVFICVTFCALFLAACAVARRYGRAANAIAGSAVVPPFVAFGFAILFLGHSALGARPGLVFSLVLAADLTLLALAWLDENLTKLHLVAGLALFGLLAAWTKLYLTPVLLPWALALYLLHAVLHTAYPLVLERHRTAAAPAGWSQFFPPLSLLLMMGPVVKLDAVPLLVWPCILLVDLIAIGLALITGSLTAVGIVLVLTLGATGLWIFRIPATLDGAIPLLSVIGVFAVLFFAAGIFLSRRLGDSLSTAGQTRTGIFGDARSQLPAFSALLPFLLLIMMTQQLRLANPSPIFGLALLLVVLVLGLAYVLSLAWLPACALAGVSALAYAWQARHGQAENSAIPLMWYLGFHALFAAYPFIFRRRFTVVTGPWAVGAASGLAFFPLVYRLLGATWPADFIGALPALFALPPLLSLFVISRRPTGDGARVRLNQLAWFGGAALAFITLVFPIQFDRQWITLGWALEGAALLWLFHRVPHGGLRGTGVVLLTVAFARLALNPAVLHYHVRSATPVLNWYLYSYGIVIACLWTGANLLAPPRQTAFGLNTPPLLNSLGTVLAFLLLNLEIADYFSRPGQAVLTFEFSGNFARDMSYTVAWALFALVLLLVSIWRQTKAGRHAAIGLLSVALLKLFLHDLARLDSLYRIGALFAVAIIASIASFAYQRWIPGHDKNVPPTA